MKRILTIILMILLTLLFSGCSKENSSVDTPVSFFYCTHPDEYEAVGSVVLPEIREAKGFENDTASLLNTYLQGPESQSLYSPFPDSVYVESLSPIEDTFHITLSSRFARLSGVDLTLACACLSKTIIEYTGCNGVTIYALNTTLDGNASITMTKDSLILESVSAEYNDH